MATGEHMANEVRSYWASQMDEAYAFMQAMRDRYASDCGEGLMSLEAAADESGVEVTFSSAKHVDGLPRLYYLREELINAFIGAARSMNVRGWVMRVEDGFRNRQMQTRIATDAKVFRQVLDRCFWESNSEQPSTELVTKRLAALVASCPANGTHMSGSAIDISVLDRSSGVEIDRGAPYLEMSANTPMDSPFVSEQARGNRDAITKLMQSHGFIAYPWEFWHYNSGDVYAAHLTGGKQKCKYGPIDWDRESNTVTPIHNPKDMLNSAETIQSMIEGQMSDET